MEDQLTATIPDPELAKLEAMAVEHDVQAAEELSAQEPEAAQPAAEKETPDSEITPDNSEAEADKKDDRPRDELGRFTKREDGTDIPESEREPAEKPAEQQPSEFEAKKQEKARKEAERLDKTWQNADRRKAELDRFEAELNQRAAQLQQHRSQPQIPQVPVDEDGEPITSKALMRAHKDFKTRAKAALDSGDYDAFNENQALADNAFDSAQRVYQLEVQRDQQIAAQQHSQIWNDHVLKIADKDPDIMNLNTPIGKEVYSILEQHGRILFMVENGADIAYDIAKMRLEAGSASELREKLTKAQKEVDELRRKTTPLGAGPTNRPGPKKLDDLPLDEQVAELGRMAERADAEAFNNA